MGADAIALPSRKEVCEYLRRKRVPVPIAELASAFGAHHGRHRKLFTRLLRAMERDGELLKNRGGEYGLIDRMDLVRGRVIGHRDGYGFLVREDGGDDLFLSPRQMRSLMHGDRAMVSISGYDHRGRPEATLVEVLERAHRELVGRLVREAGSYRVVPDESRIRHDVLIAAADTGGARSGDIVVVEITGYPDKRQRCVAKVVEVLGPHLAPGMEIDVAIRSHSLPVVFPEPALVQAAKLGGVVKPHQKRAREDLRALPLVTIDGADARDFDDAVHCRRTANGWKLVVAIADVASYVKAGSALDLEAFNRGNSVYFPDRVVPMLPETLSNGLCSLNPNVDRLCMVCEMVVNRRGEVTRSRFFEGLMRSHARLTYDLVARVVVDRERAAREECGELALHLDELYALYQAFAGARDARGALELDTHETQVLLDSDGKVERVAPLVRNDAHRIIEECMVATNVCAARFVARHKVPVLYRVHDGAKADGLEVLRRFLSGLRLTLGGGSRPTPKHYRALLEKVRSRPDSASIQTMVLRSMAQAVYTPDNAGHFGLALDAYAHFTSPIRRYADLVLHRAIKHALKSKRGRGYGYDHARLSAMGEHVSMTERRADDATRDAIAWLKCEFMLNKVGEVFTGRVSAVTSFGLFVTLDELFIEGLVHISAIGHDYFHFDPDALALTGESSGERFTLGDALTVRVTRVDLDERKVDFERVVTRRTGRASTRPLRRRARYR